MAKSMERGFSAVALDISGLEEKVEKLPTEERVREIVREETKPQFDKVNRRLDSVESKVDGTNHRLDTEAMRRTDLKISRRLHDVEEKVYGVGGSKNPKHIPL